MVAKVTRLYEVGTTDPKAMTGDRPADSKVYLVEATSGPAANKHVAAKFVKKAELAAPKRIAELMKAGVMPEVAKEGEVE